MTYNVAYVAYSTIQKWARFENVRLNFGVLP